MTQPIFSASFLNKEYDTSFPIIIIIVAVVVVIIYDDNDMH